jgi:hypothetical protein
VRVAPWRRPAMGVRMTVQEWVAYAALAAGVICFLIYLAEALAALLVKPSAVNAAKDVSAQAKTMGVPLTVDDFTKLLDAMSKLTDSLAKAGPALTSLIGAILFFAIAAVASGAIVGSPPAPAAHSDGAHNAPAAQTPPAKGG